MSDFKDFLEQQLTDLESHLNRPLAYKDIAEASGLARGTFYNWANGGPASAESIRKFVAGLAALGNGTDYRPPAIAQVAAAIAAPDTRAVAKTPLAFINYGPIVQQSPRAGSFLGGLMRQFAAVSQVCEALPESEEPGFGLDDMESPRRGDPTAIVGLFMMPHRAVNWAPLRLPLQMPLNAVLFHRDLIAFVERVLRERFGKASPSAEDYLSSIEEGLWNPKVGQPAGWISDLQFIVAEGEAGERFLRLHEGVALRETSFAAKPKIFHDRLWEGSEAFHAALRSGQHDDTSRRLPIIVADEMSCLEVLRAHGKSAMSARTLPILLSGHAGTARGSSIDVRPCFPISVAFRREHPGDRGYSFDVIQEEFREFVVSFRGIITDEYVRLHSDLRERFDGLVDAPVASLVLKWLSLEAAVHRAAGAPPATAVLADLPGVELWRGILDAAARAILDSDLGPSVRGALGLGDAGDASTEGA